MQSLGRRRLVIAVSLGVPLLMAAGVLLFVLRQDLVSRAALVSAGMPREQVETILGPPVLELRRADGSGKLLAWVDQLWQVDVVTGPDGCVESVRRVPSDSAYRRGVRWFTSLYR